MQVSVADLQAVSEIASKVDANPFRLAGRFLGLSGAEARAGVPAWGYCALALGVGFLGGVLASQTDFLREKLGVR